MSILRYTYRSLAKAAEMREGKELLFIGCSAISKASHIILGTEAAMKAGIRISPAVSVAYMCERPCAGCSYRDGGTCVQVQSMGVFGWRAMAGLSVYIDRK